jgi:hypothetical protein
MAFIRLRFEERTRLGCWHRRTAEGGLRDAGAPREIAHPLFSICAEVKPPPFSAFLFSAFQLFLP